MPSHQRSNHRLHAPDTPSKARFSTNNQKRRRRGLNHSLRDAKKHLWRNRGNTEKRAAKQKRQLVKPAGGSFGKTGNLHSKRCSRCHGWVSSACNCNPDCVDAALDATAQSVIIDDASIRVYRYCSCSGCSSIGAGYANSS